MLIYCIASVVGVFKSLVYESPEQGRNYKRLMILGASIVPALVAQHADIESLTV